MRRRRASREAAKGRGYLAPPAPPASAARPSPRMGRRGPAPGPPPPSHWRSRGAGSGVGSVALSPPSPALRPLAARYPAAMLRAAARFGPRLGLRFLSAAATQAVPAPNQQPEVFCNKVSPPARLALCSPAQVPAGPAPPWASVYPSGARGTCRG